MQIGFHASHEQFKPSLLLALTKAAERAGFDAAMSSDHFHPWSRRQGESGFAWSWLGAALEGTSLPFGVVCAPGQRYHPAVIAQAAATLAEMYPGRLWVALGSGQLLNEGIAGSLWPTKEERNARLRECADIMRALWRGETVAHRGRVTVEEALRGAWEEWRPTILGGPVQSTLRTPEMFEAAARFVKPEDLRGPVRVSADLQRHIDWLRGDLDMGFERLFLHNVNREQQRFIDDFGERVLPALRR